MKWLQLIYTLVAKWPKDREEMKEFIIAILIVLLAGCGSTAHVDTCELSRYLFCPIQEDKTNGRTQDQQKAIPTHEPSSQQRTAT